MNTFLLVNINSSDPFERGVQYGRQAVEYINNGIECYKQHFEKSVQMSWQTIGGNSSRYIQLLESECIEELMEARGIAEGANVSINDIMALNCRYEILKMKPQECTSASILPQATGVNKTFIIQNWDYRPWVMNNSVIISIDDGKGTKILGLTEAGQLVRNGFNNHGVGICANNLTSTSDNDGIGIPVTFLRRKVLNSKSFSEAANTIANAARAVSCNYMLASSEGIAADFESTPDMIYRVNPVDGVVTHANHLVAGKEVCTNQGKRFRDDYLRNRIMEHIGSVDVETLKQCLSDHKRYPGSADVYPEVDCIEAVCTHVPHGDFDCDKVWQTIASVIYDLNGGCAYICKGTPCSGKYVKYNL